MVKVPFHVSTFARIDSITSNHVVSEIMCILMHGMVDINMGETFAVKKILKQSSLLCFLVR